MSQQNNHLRNNEFYTSPLDPSLMGGVRPHYSDIFPSKLSCGKIILCGEHFVVYGNSAIAIPAHSTCISGHIEIISQEESGMVFKEEKLDHLALRSIIELVWQELHLTDPKPLPKLHIDLQVKMPMGRGMGASAAMCIALSKAFAKVLNRQVTLEQLISIAQKTETIFHGRPSGIDHTVVAFEQPLWFQKGQAPRFLKVTNPLNLLIVDSLRNGNTREAVSVVQNFAQKNATRFAQILKEANSISMSLEALVFQDKNNLHSLGNDVSVPELFFQNQQLLAEVGVNVAETQEIITLAEKEGLPGAKISGAGLGGVVIISGPAEHLQYLGRKFECSGLPVYYETLTPLKAFAGEIPKHSFAESIL